MAFSSGTTLKQTDQRQAAAFASASSGGVSTTSPRFDPYLWEEYGGISSKTQNQTTTFKNFISDAASAGSPIYLGQGTDIVVSPSSPIDLTGIPAIVGDNVTLDVSGAHDFSSGAIFKSVGSRTELAQDITNDAGDAEITVGTGHSIEPGDPVIIASDENHPSGATVNNNRDYYKGERVYVEEYFDADGTGGADTIRVSPHLHFTYNGANNRVYLLSENELTIGKGVTIKGAVGSKQRGLLLDTVNADINCEFQNVTERCIAAVRSSVRFGGVIQSSSDGTTPTTRYGVHCAGFTDLRIDSAEIWAGRHAVTQASGGFSTLDLADGSSTNTAAGYSSRMTVSGGTYGNLAQQDSHKLSAIDTHGTTLNCSISGANVYGGVSVAADYMTISGSYIEANEFRCMYVTADVAPSDKDWCSLTVDGCTLRVVGSPSNNPDAQFFNTKRDPDFDGDEGMRSLVFTDCTLRGDYYQSSTRPLEVRLPVRDGIKFNGNDAKVEYTNETFPDQTQCLFGIWSDIEFKNNTFQGTEVEIQPWRDTDIQDTDYVIDCTGTTVKDSFRRGLRLDGTDKNPDDGSDTAHQIGKVILNDVRVQGCARQGVSIVHADTVYAGDAVMVDNGTDTSASDNQRSNLELVDVSLFISGDSDYSASSADTNQAIFIDHTANSWAPSTTKLRLTSVDVTTASSGANIDDANATTDYDARFNIETDKPEVLTDLLHRPDIVDTTTDAGATGEIRRNGGTVSMYAGSKVAIRNAGDAQISLIGDTNANQGGTQEWGITTVASDSDLVIRDETAGQVRLVVDGDGDVGLGGYTTPSFAVEMNGALRIRNSSSDPSSVGEFRVNGNDVKVYSGGSVRNLSNIGSGAAGSNTEVQFNDSGSFGASSTLTFDDGNVSLKVGSTFSAYVLGTSLQLEGGMACEQVQLAKNRDSSSNDRAFLRSDQGDLEYVDPSGTTHTVVSGSN